MKTCPKCGSPQESPKLDGTTARIWFTCGSYGYLLVSISLPPQHAHGATAGVSATVDRGGLEIGIDWCVPPMIADEALTAIEDVRENAEAECVQIVDGIVRPVPWDNWRNCANQLLESLKYIHSICEDKTIELPDDDYAKTTIDECIMEAERAMQKCKKMEGEAK